MVKFSVDEFPEKIREKCKNDPQQYDLYNSMLNHRMYGMLLDMLTPLMAMLLKHDYVGGSKEKHLEAMNFIKEKMKLYE